MSGNESCVIMTEQCEKRFEAADRDRDEIKKLLKESIQKSEQLSDRLYKTNGKRAIIEEIRDNKKANERLEEKLDEHLEEVESRPEQVSTMSIPDTTKFELGKFKVTTNNVEIASAFMRFIYLAAVISAILYGKGFLDDMKSGLHSRIDNVEAAVNE